MSHRKQRTDTNCLNCGSIVAGKYCQNCGQENIELKETFFQIILHFIEDLTHFDGKIVKTLKFLITKPAFLSKEYMHGKRVTYIHPIRMYIFISAVFFLFIFSGDANNEPLKINNSANQANSGIVFGDSTYKTIPAYEIAQKSLPIDKRDSWLETKIKKQQILINQKYGNDQRKINAALIDNFKKILHDFNVDENRVLINKNITQKYLEYESVNVLDIEEDYLLPVALETEKTEDEDIDRLLVKLNAIYKKISEKKVSPEEKKAKSERGEWGGRSEDGGGGGMEGGA
jgi:hypothetical protein